MRLSRAPLEHFTRPQGTVTTPRTSLVLSHEPHSLMRTSLGAHVSHHEKSVYGTYLDHRMRPSYCLAHRLLIVGGMIAGQGRSSVRERTI